MNNTQATNNTAKDSDTADDNSTAKANDSTDDNSMVKASDSADDKADSQAPNKCNIREALTAALQAGYRYVRLPWGEDFYDLADFLEGLPVDKGADDYVQTNGFIFRRPELGTDDADIYEVAKDEPTAADKEGEADNSDNNGTDDNADTVYPADKIDAIRTATGLNADDAAFLYEVMGERMEMDWDLHFKAHAQKALEQDKKYFDLLDELPEEQRAILNKHSDHETDRLRDEAEFYYKSGFHDGVLVSNTIRDVK